jgi:hypothetical protein
MDKPSHICQIASVINSRTEARMALSSHLQELSEKHRQLERKIAEEIGRPGSDDLTIRRLKREKLKLKDQITRLASDTRH